MSENFEIVGKDVMGRIAKLKTQHGTVETPTLMPVINPNIEFIPAIEMKKFGAEILITNSYIIHRTIGEEALDKGVHKILGVDLPVMTDSGSYQLMVYGDVEIDNRTIVDFQQKIGSDIIVPLDIPTPPDADYDTALNDLEMTIKREREAVEIVKDSLIALPIQGSTHLDLRKKSAEEAIKLNGDVYPIGAVVPLMDAYRFTDLVRIILEVKGVIKTKPIHLFGCGHPMIFAIAVALGCDLFDSAAYALYAKDGRYLTPYGTKKLEELHYFPCSCPVCLTHTPEELRRMDKKDRELLIAEHNLWVSFEELRLIKQAIKENTLFELVEKRIRSHPYLVAAWRKIKEYRDLIEKFDPVVKKAFFYLGIESIYRPAVSRHHRRVLELIEDKPEFKISTSELILADFYLKPVFGVIPSELIEIYPCRAEMPEVEVIEEEAIIIAVEKLKEFLNTHSNRRFQIFVNEGWLKYLKDIPENGVINVID
ncbi:tRNA guanosine(15) transglycosylase TgtA [Archaeoglobales archaeon]|nr:MAG: tRNA guanosine(15) transglycosylase TgtA [Archaeoglobales archaeon]